VDAPSQVTPYTSIWMPNGSFTRGRDFFYQPCATTKFPKRDNPRLFNRLRIGSSAHFIHDITQDTRSKSLQIMYSAYHIFNPTGIVTEKKDARANTSNLSYSAQEACVNVRSIK